MRRYIRLPSRLPVSLLIWLVAMAFPFYGAINSLMSAISVPFTAFALPFFVYCYLYRTKEARDNAALKPLRILQVRLGLGAFLFLCTFCTFRALFACRTVWPGHVPDGQDRDGGPWRRACQPCMQCSLVQSPLVCTTQSLTL